MSGFPCNDLAFGIRFDGNGDVQVDVEDAPCYSSTDYKWLSLQCLVNHMEIRNDE